jgi:RecA/RadA recombinase
MCGFGSQRRALRQQAAMQTKQLQAQEKLAADQAKAEENARRKPVSTLLTGAMDSTNLTGAGGVAASALTLGRNTLLGG